MIPRQKVPRDLHWQHVSGGISRDENGWAKIYLAVEIDGRQVGQVIAIKHERLNDPNSAFRRTLDHMVRDIDVAIKYRVVP